MELTSKHRRALLDELDSAKQRKELVCRIELTDGSTVTNYYKDIEDYILIKTIEVIEKALIENEIDY